MATRARKPANDEPEAVPVVSFILAAAPQSPRGLDFNALRDPFDKADIHWRAQSVTKSGDKALALAYIDARNVMERLDAVVGPDNWQDTYEETAKGRVICTLSLRVNGQWISKADGAGNTDVEGDKGAVSDALKRAAVKWGIGRYLYSMPATWVPCECFAEKRNNKWVWKRWTRDPWDFVTEDPSLPRLGVEEPPYDPETGEILDEDEAGTRQPAPRQKLDGLHKTRTALREAVCAVIAAVRAAEDEEAIDAILRKAKSTIQQANKEWPGLINGDPNNADDPGLKGAVTAMRETLGNAVVSGLIDSMKECGTIMALTNWRATNEEVIDSLDGADSRKFELAWNLHESAITTMDTVRA